MTMPASGSRQRATHRLVRAALLGGALCGAPGAAGAQALQPLISGYVTLTSDYRHRGLSESGGHASLQAGADYQHTSGAFAGVWAARIDSAYPAASDSSTRFKVGYYAGVSRRVARWSWNAAVVHYAYPGAPYDYDYDELSATIGFRDRVFATAAYIDGLLARDTAAFYREVGTAFPMPLRLELGATLGRLTSSDSRLEYTHWNLGLSRVFRQRFSVDLRYHDGSRYIANAIATTDAGAWVFSASYGFRTP